jgi:hypothetical protein
MANETVYLCGDEAPRRFDGETFAPASLKEAKRGFCAAMVPVSLLRSHSFKIPLGTSDEKFATLVEITMFEEGGLDIDREYAIAYVRHALDFDGSWLVEAFAAERDELEKRFGPAASKTGHIDLLAVPYLAYEGLYRFERADAAAVELFLYLGDEASYAVLCKEGRYLTHRTLPSLASLALKAGVDAAVLVEALRERGLLAENYGPDERLLLATLQEAFGEIVERIAHTVSHKRGVFGIGGIDAIFLDFGLSEIPGLWELFDGYGFEESRKGVVRCCEALPPEAQHEGIEALYLLAAASGRLDAPNLTVFEKRPGFLQTHTGRFLAAAAAALLLVGGYGATTRMELDGLARERSSLEAQLRTMRAEAKKLTARLKAERSRRDAVRERLERRRRELMAFDEAADTMLMIKASKAKRQAMMRDVDEALRQYRLSATWLEQNGSRAVRVDVLTPFAHRARIAKFMKRLVDEGYAKVGTREIRLDENLYQSRVEIVR